MTSPAAEPLAKIQDLFGGLLAHDGFGDLRVEVRLLRRGQREVIVHCGRQYRYVVDTTTAPQSAVPKAVGRDI